VRRSLRSASLTIVTSVIAPKKLDVTWCLSRSVRYGVEVFHRPFGINNRYSWSKSFPSLDARWTAFLHGDEIFRMGALEKKLQAWFGRSVVLEDPERFIWPEYLSGRDIPAKAPGTAQSLRFSQIHFAVQ
jgi:hypothetical protein